MNNPITQKPKLSPKPRLKLSQKQHAIKAYAVMLPMGFPCVDTVRDDAFMANKAKEEIYGVSCDYPVVPVLVWQYGKAKK
jgi:hypothetical protein